MSGRFRISNIRNDHPIFRKFVPLRTSIVGVISLIVVFAFALVPRLYGLDSTLKLWGDMWYSYMVPFFTVLGFFVAVCVFILFHLQIRVQILFVIVITAITSSLLLYAGGTWGEGLFSELSSNDVSCEIVPQVPLANVFPRRILNFYMGSESCPYHKTFSSVDAKSQMLTVENCDAKDDPMYTNSTNYLGLASADQLNEFDAENLVSRVLKQHGNHPHTKLRYSHPEKVFDENLSVFCGEGEEYHMNHFLREKLVQKCQTRTNPKCNGANKCSPDILVIMIDALSRAHFLRTLTTTSSVLKKLQHSKDSKYSVFEFFRYMTVGHNTGPNLVPFMTGRSESELGGMTKEEKTSSFIWNRFEDYLSLWMVEQCQDYFANYFRVKSDIPVDVEVAAHFCHPEYMSHTNTHGPYSMIRRCIGNTYVHELTLNYLRQFWNDNYPECPKFGFVSFLEAHEGTLSVVKTLDKDLASFIKDVTDKNDETLIVLFSDHGNHMGPIFEFTGAGSMEHLLPALYLITPEWVLNRMDSIYDRDSGTTENMLRGNEQNLLTVYDLYSTLSVLQHLQNDKKIDEKSDMYLGLPGIPLFSEISGQRSCEDAKIPDKFCACGRKYLDAKDS